MNAKTSNVPVAQIEHAIYLIRGQRVMLDKDLACIYGVPTKRLKEQVRRNADRFPPEFMFQLTREEIMNLRSQFATSSSGWGGTRYLPMVFTEHGAIMAATVLNSRRAVEMSIFVVRVFVRMREQLIDRAELEKRLAVIEKTLMAHSSALRDLYQKIRPLLLPPPEKPKRRIGFGVGERRARYKLSVRRSR